MLLSVNTPSPDVTETFQVWVLGGKVSRSGGDLNVVAKTRRVVRAPGDGEGIGVTCQERFSRHVGQGR